MEKNYERQNEQLRRNIELLEQGITVKKYLLIENDIEVEGSTAIYNYFGIFIIYSESEKRFNLKGCPEKKDEYSKKYMGDYIHRIIDPKSYKKHLRRCFLNDFYILKYFRLNPKEYPTIEEYLVRQEDTCEKYVNAFIQLDGKVLQEYWDMGYLHYTSINDEKTIVKYQIQVMARSLLHLRKKSRFLYEILNMIVDILVKSLPFFIWLLYMNKSSLLTGVNIVQKGSSLIAGILGSYLAGIFMYLICLVMIFVIDLIVFKSIYTIKLKIFDWIIDKSV